MTIKCFLYVLVLQIQVLTLNDTEIVQGIIFDVSCNPLLYIDVLKVQVLTFKELNNYIYILNVGLLLQFIY